MDASIKFLYNKSMKQEVKIYVGAGTLSSLGEIFQSNLGDTDKLFILSDENILHIYGDYLLNLVKNSIQTEIIAVPSGEVNKNLATLDKVIELLFEKGITSKSCLCGFGGGIIGNMTGLISSIAFRGIKFFSIPTTLISQLDSSIGAKQSVNTSSIKNGLGSFFPPEFVIVDPILLRSLDKREMRSGLAEALKHSFVQEPDFKDYIVNVYTNNLITKDTVIEKIIQKTIALKVQYFKSEKDIWEKNNDHNKITHFGHTIGKILEITKPDFLTHGEAISHGMVIESYLSALQGYLSQHDIKEIYDAVSEIELLNPNIEFVSVNQIIEKTKSKTGVIQFPLLQKLGGAKMIVCEMPGSFIEKALSWHMYR